MTRVVALRTKAKCGQSKLNKILFLDHCAPHCLDHCYLATVKSLLKEEKHEKLESLRPCHKELKILVEALQNGEKHLRLGKVYYTGSIGRHEVVLVESGIRKVMSAISVAVLCQLFKVEAIINTGSAGAVAPGMALLGISSLPTNWPIMMWM